MNTDICIDPNYHSRETLPEDWMERLRVAETIAGCDNRLTLATWRLLLDAIENGLPISVTYLARRNDWNSPGPLYRDTVTGIVTELHTHTNSERIGLSCWGIHYTLHICNIVDVQTPKNLSERVE